MADETSQGGGVARLERAAWAAAMGAATAVLAPASLLSEGRAAVGERLGSLPRLPSPKGPRLVLHGVSAGEMTAAGALLSPLVSRLPGVSFVLTSGTPAGRAVAERLAAERPEVEDVRYLPWDRRAALDRWLCALAPAAVVVVETELWPALFFACRDRGIPLLVASGRIYPRDRARYRHVRRLFREVLGAAAWIGAQDEDERQAFLSIGAPPERTVVAGNLKLDALPPGRPLAEPWESALACGRPLLVGGSTHAPEEAWLAGALLRLRAGVPDLGLVLAPRRVRRVLRLCRLLRRTGLRVARLSEPVPRGGWDVLVVDGYGSLAALYRHAAVAFAGGSLVPRGGQSPFEAAAAGCPVVAGGCVDHFAAAYRGLVAAGGAVGVEGPEPVAGLAAALRPLLTDGAAREAAGTAARRWLESRRGAAEATATAIAEAVRSKRSAATFP